MRNLYKKMRVLAYTIVFLFSIAGTSGAIFGLEYNWIHIIDADGEPITSGVIVTIQDTSGATATIYQFKYTTATTVTNPKTISSASDNPIGFYYTADFDVKLEDANGNAFIYEDLTLSDHRVVWPKAVYTDIYLSGDIKIAGDIDIEGNNIDLGDANIDYDTSNYRVNIDTAVFFNSQIPIEFGVTVDTTSVTPTGAGQFILGDDYGVYISSVAGGNWYRVGGK